MADRYSLCLLDICNHISDSEKQTWGIYTIINELQHASLELSDSFVTPWTVACQAPLSMRFPGQEYWSRLPFPSPGDLFHSGIQPASPARVPHWQVDSLPLNHWGSLCPWNTYG